MRSGLQKNKHGNFLLADPFCSQSFGELSDGTIAHSFNICSMLIGQLSKRTGFSKDTIRYYEKIQLIVVPKPKKGSSYKDYPESLVATLRAIRKFKQLGFTLEEIRELLIRESMKVLDISRLIQLVEYKITGIDDQINRLHEMKLQLNRELQALRCRKTGHILTLPEMKLAA